MKKYFLLAVAILIPVLIIVFYYKFYNEEGMLSVQCGFHLLTGLQCPGCGGQRAFHHILHGEVLTALRYNSVLVLGLPFLAYMYYVIVQVHILKSNKFNNSFIYSAKFGYTVLVVLAVFWIIRNIPIMPFIYLSPPS